MAELDDVLLISRQRRTDDRGWFLKVIDGGEKNLGAGACEVYLTAAIPGASRGGHYHRETNEWFTLVAGAATAILAKPSTGEENRMRLRASEPVTVYVPSGIAHVFVNDGESMQEAVIVAYADKRYDEDDTVPYAFKVP